MSNDAVARFLDTLDESSDLRDELGAALEGKEEQAPSIVEVAKQHGIAFEQPKDLKKAHVAEVLAGSGAEVAVVVAFVLYRRREMFHDYIKD